MIAPRSDLGLRAGYHSAQVDVEVRLNTNESPLPPPDSWVEELADAVGTTEFHRYPDRSAHALRGRLADLHGVDVAQVFVANGSNEVLQSVLLGYGGPGRRALTFEPTYALHGHIAHLTGTEVVAAARREDFSVDLDVALDAIRTTQPSVTFLCHPNNPTGNGEARTTVDALLRAAPGLLVVDEAYGQFADWTALDLADDETPLVVTRTFSKTWSMAAVRLGYCVAPRAVVEVLERVALPYHLDALKQQAGALALGHVAEMEQRVALIVHERERIIGELGEIGVQVWPSQANFVLFDPHRGDVWQGLVDRSVLVRDTSSWPGLVGSLRVTVGTAEENDRFLEALREVLA